MPPILDTSEESYLNLVQSLSSCLDLSDLPEQRSLVQLSPNIEREVILKERQGTVELLSQRIGALKDQIQHKDDLLVEYERDLGVTKKRRSRKCFKNCCKSKPKLCVNCLPICHSNQQQMESVA
ncbi:unnamed protein product [Schistosoma turkestanicum]|nr:unnamed protein product [Schistosoma turkestanicum]